MNPYESELRSVCEQLIKEAITIGREIFASAELPVREVVSSWVTAKESGGFEGQWKTVLHKDLESFWIRCRNRIEQLPQWGKANALFNSYEEFLGTAPESEWLRGDISQKLIDEYLRGAGRFEFLQDVADSIIEGAIQHGKSELEWAVRLVVLQGLSAPAEFELEPEFKIRPITQSELEEFGQGASPTRDWFRNALPRDDWWVAEIKASGAKGSIESWNTVQRTDDLLGLAFRMFKSGELIFPFTKIYIDGTFGPSVWGGKRAAQIVSRRGGPYSLSSDEIQQFQNFWLEFRQLVEADEHYLQLPARRLLFGGDRSRLDDSLVDYVIGLEGLLSKGNERTELRYRFSVRGAVVLASEPDERATKFKQMQDLYDLRSAIVHGSKPTLEKLSEAVVTAEDALRTCWHWYFENWRSEKNNEKAINEIDRQLFLVQ